MRQYAAAKSQNPDALLFFRMGDFYELFFEDAQVAARELQITLTARDRERSVPMCGVPYHAADAYLSRLLRKGYRVAICEQMEDPKLTKKIVRREGTRVLTPGTAVDFVDTLHFTTWTFQPGHRIRIAVANAQFPMAWPTPYAMTTRLATNDARSALELPTIPADAHAKVPHVPPPEPRTEAPDARTIPRGRPAELVVTHDVLAKTTTVEFVTRDAYAIGQRDIDNIEKERYETHDDHPADSRFLGDEVHVIHVGGGRTLRVRTVIDMRSDSAAFHVAITRSLYVGDALVRTRNWTDAIPRGIH